MTLLPCLGRGRERGGEHLKFETVVLFFGFAFFFPKTWGPRWLHWAPCTGDWCCRQAASDDVMARSQASTSADGGAAGIPTPIFKATSDGRPGVGSPPSTLYSILSVLCSLLSTLYSVQSALYSLPSTLYALCSTLYSLLSTLYPLVPTPQNQKTQWKTKKTKKIKARASKNQKTQ